MLILLKNELSRVGSKHISRTVKANKSLFAFTHKHTSHLKTKNISEQIYLVLNSLIEKPRCYCGKDLKFESLIKGYTIYCSVKCSRNSIETKKSFLEKIVSRTDEDRQQIYTKRKSSVMQKYGVDNVSQSEEIKEKKKQISLLNYGVEYTVQSKEIKLKIKNTNLEKYGVNTPLQSEEIKLKIKNTNLERYGVENPMQNENIKNRAFDSHRKKYGGIGFQVDKGQFDNLDRTEIQEKIKETNLVRYGVEHVFQAEVVQEKIKETNLVRYGVENYFSYKEFIEQNSNRYMTQYIKRVFEQIKDVYSPLFGIEEYFGQGCYMWIHHECGRKFEYTTSGDHPIPICPGCYPRRQGRGVSKMETSLFESLNITNKTQSNKSILMNRRELDIYLPYHNLAIEFNGLYWHSELNGKDKNYHLNKTIECEQKSIQLIHVFENEWLEKQNIVKSIIDSKLGQFSKIIHVRECQIKKVRLKEKNQFLKDNHLQGSDKSSIKLGLYYENELVSVITFGKSRHNKKYQYEIHRYCSKIGYQIIGGASNLFKHFIRNYSPKSIITYADRRYSNGEFYKKIGFEKLNESKPNYFYFKGNSGLMSRIQFQKHKLKDKLDSFNPDLTEWENMQLNGYDRIWDCGNFVYGWCDK